ncbi:MAG: hypothetical protein H5T69_06355 [Chloroflexi bacterium]|nr:hypothetical protein [Chloroflexota bacterium]
MKAEFVLTVAESKRLIAKGVAALDIVREKLQEGVIVVTSGSTNAYVYEELMGETIDKRAYVSGRTMPATAARTWNVERMPDLVLVNGKPRPDLDRFSVLEVMKEGDIYIKGANALNYAAGVAGVTIGHPTGGTLGGALGAVISKKLRLLIPVGLEKEIPYDLQDVSAMIAEPDETLGRVYSLWPVRGQIFTEIEALRVLCGVEAVPTAAGGIGGAEGGLRLMVRGDAEGVRATLELVKSIQGEPALG